MPLIRVLSDTVVGLSTDTWKLSMGALVGLVSGRDRNHSQNEDEDRNDDT